MNQRVGTKKKMIGMLIGMKKKKWLIDILKWSHIKEIHLIGLKIENLEILDLSAHKFSGWILKSIDNQTRISQLRSPIWQIK